MMDDDDDDLLGERPANQNDRSELRRLFYEARKGLATEIERSRGVIVNVSETLKRANHALAEARGDTPFRSARTQPRRILIVDDNIDAALVLQRGLIALGHVVEVAHTPSAAITLAVHLVPDIALLDIGLPEIDGWELAENLRRYVRPMHVIAVTGYSRDIDKERSRMAGFVEHLAKPVDLRYLARRVGELAPAA